MLNVKLKGLPFPASLALKLPSDSCDDRRPVALSSAAKRPEVTVCDRFVVAQSDRVSPTFTVIVVGWNISELSSITGAAEADDVVVGAAGVSARGLQPGQCDCCDGYRGEY